MTLKPAVLTGTMMSTWSLFEAACYVHNLDPQTIEKPLLANSTQRHVKTYFWLLKEFDRKRIWRAPNTEGDEPRFIPGTITRHLIEKEKCFYKPVHDAYLKHGATTGPSSMNAEAKRIYRYAGAILRNMHPSIRKTQVAQLLVDLPVHLKDKTLPSYGEMAIRRYLKDDWPAQPGRPPKGEDQLPEIDWPELVKQLIL